MVTILLDSGEGGQGGTLLFHPGDGGIAVVVELDSRTSQKWQKTLQT